MQGRTCDRAYVSQGHAYHHPKDTPMYNQPTPAAPTCLHHSPPPPHTELRGHYSEALLLVPPSHHVLPHATLYGETQNAPPYPRQALGLPPPQTRKSGSSQGEQPLAVLEGGVGDEGMGLDRVRGGAVLACFNRVKKLDGKTWETWLQVRPWARTHTHTNTHMGVPLSHDGMGCRF